MFPLIVMILSSILLTALILILTLLFPYKLYTIKEKISPFECGFNPHLMTQIPFSINFFMIALIFNIFDVELILIFPIPFSIPVSSTFTSIFLSSTILTLLLGLLYEWYYGSLSWLN